MENTDVLIVGAGVSGLSAAHFLRKMAPGLNVVLLEKSQRVGGAIRSHREQGFLAEWGPHGFLDNAPASQELLQDTGLEAEVQKAPLADFHRYLCHGGKLVQIPQKPLRALTTPLLSPAAKFRILADLWIRPLAEDQTIGQWAGRRFGKRVLPLVDAAISGSFSGDFNRLSIDAVMPGLRQLEHQYGSVLKGVLSRARQQKNDPKKGLPAMINFSQGLERVVTVLARDLDIRLQTPVEKLERTAECWQLATREDLFSARELVMALPVNGSLGLLAALAPPPVERVPVSRIYNVVLGFSDEGVIPPGFGYLAPECEQRFTLGAMFSSRMFPARAPAGGVLIEALVGGRRHPERLELDDAEIITRVRQDLAELLDLPQEPLLARVLRPEGGIPQLEMDHPAVLAYRRKLEEQAGLHICGFGWDGIGINDMTRAARKAAVDIAQGSRGEEKAEVKPVYF
ncbi:MAG: protoporphyrinogen oxidase [Arenicellales bacterium]|jgi:oxygen-dependent protoporphyrinogen oxidase|nr:protoporphyrinogen oxidase [Arenicellales bacterium]|tara:strand:+ start:5386 stop:6753 length:1368 start_codon:yes stop_codon:yes gene_type:complete